MIDRGTRLRLMPVLLVLLLATPMASALKWDEEAWKKASAGKNFVVLKGSEDQVIYDGGTTSATYTITNWIGSTMSVTVAKKSTPTAGYVEIATLAAGESVDVAGFAIRVQGASAQRTDIAGVFYGRT